jgi:hypothetical protein
MELFVHYQVDEFNSMITHAWSIKSDNIPSPIRPVLIFNFQSSILNFVEAPIGLEPMNRGFADLSLSHLGTAPFTDPLFQWENYCIPLTTGCPLLPMKNGDIILICNSK